MDHYQKTKNSYSTTFHEFIEGGKTRLVTNYYDGTTIIRTETHTQKTSFFGEPSTKEEFEKNFVNAMIQNGVFDFYRIVGMAVKESVQNQIKVRNN